MEKVFESILLNYGGYVLTCIRNFCELNELYEECQEINNTLVKYNINTKMTLQDWIAEFYKKGYSGQIALYNASSYILEAIQICKKEGIFSNLKEEVLP